MPDVVANPEQIEEFARSLAAFTVETREALLRLNGRLHELGASSWQDARYEEYEGLYADVQHQLVSALDTVDNEHIQFLRSLANRLRSYL